MTMVVPCRVITRQRSHMGLTDGRTFISSVPVGDSTAVEVVRAELHLDLVPGEDADVVLAHLPGDRGENVMPGVELHPEHRARERLDDFAFHLDLLFLLRHFLSVPRFTHARQSRARRFVIVAKRLQPQGSPEATPPPGRASAVLPPTLPALASGFEGPRR